MRTRRPERPRRRLGCGALTLASTVLVAACGSGPPVSDAPPPAPVLDPVSIPGQPSPSPASVCEAATSEDPTGEPLEVGPGSYRLILVRGDADSHPAWADGALRLTPRPEGLRGLDGWETPLQGTAEIEIERVGAYRVGSLVSEDPAAPGVLVLRSPDPRPDVLLRFGSSANRTDRTAFDEAYTVLTVTRVDGEGFAGSWRSGRSGDRVSGHFCALDASG